MDEQDGHEEQYRDQWSCSQAGFFLASPIHALMRQPSDCLPKSLKLITEQSYCDKDNVVQPPVLNIARITPKWQSRTVSSTVDRHNFFSTTTDSFEF